ncbi:MAG: hypothetical protein EOM72_06605 [Opitutae bacterium]|nr:hypothetical protein [Opitutae bacterium]
MVLFFLPAVQAGDNAHRIGVGANYWMALDDLDEDFDDNGLSYLASYQYWPTLIGLQADVEFLPDMFGEDAIAPAAYLLLGKAIYAAAGVGIVNQDGEWADDPFFALKVGLDLEVLPSLYLDISGSYRFNSEVDLEDAFDAIDTDTVFLGAAVRIGF